MHKSVGRAATAGVVVSIPAALVAASASKAIHATQIGSIDYVMWACIAPAQAAMAWVGASLASHISSTFLSRIFGLALAITGAVMLSSALRST